MGFASEAERRASKVLFPLGFELCNDERFSTKFRDKNGEEFSAMPDFVHRELGIFVEVKDRSLNDKDSKAEATEACRMASPGLKRYAPGFHQSINQWNNSAEKVAITQQVVGKDNLIVVFVRPIGRSIGEREKRTMELIIEKGIHACDLEYFPRMFQIARLTKLWHTGNNIAVAAAK